MRQKENTLEIHTFCVTLIALISIITGIMCVRILSQYCHTVLHNLFCLRHKRF